jgi:hypothetical protein
MILLIHNVMDDNSWSSGTIYRLKKLKSKEIPFVFQDAASVIQIPPAAGRAEGSPLLAATMIKVLCDTPLLAAG